MTTVLASGPETQLGSKLLLSALILLAFAGAALADAARLPAPRGSPGGPAGARRGARGPRRGRGRQGVYASTTTHGDWLDRIAVHGLGVRSNARAAV